MLRWLVGKIMERQMKKEIAKDKKFQKEIADYNREIKRCSDSIEADIKCLESIHGPIKRHGVEWTCLKCGKTKIPFKIDVCPKCGTNFQKYARQLNEERKKRDEEEWKTLSEAEKTIRIIKEKEKHRRNNPNVLAW